MVTLISLSKGKKPSAHNVLSRITKRTASLNVYRSVLFPQGVLRPVKNNKLVIAFCFPKDRSTGVLMDIVYLTTWVRYSILQIILVARENGFTSKQLIFCLPSGAPRWTAVNSSQTFIWIWRNWPGMMWGIYANCEFGVCQKMWIHLDCHV